MLPKILTTKRDFIEFFSAIPDDKWVVGTPGDYQSPNGACCAVGHCLRHDRSFRWGETPSHRNLEHLLIDTLSVFPQHVNDACEYNGTNKKYPQPTPKARILAALKDLPDRP